MITLMALLGAWSGGSLWPSHYLDRIKATWLPEVILAVLIGALSTPYILLNAFLIVGIYLAIQSGTWIILPWRDKGVRSLTRQATLKPISDWIADKLNVEFDSVQYAAIYAAVKGFLITLPIGGLGAIYMPLAYELGYRLDSGKYRTLTAEMLFFGFIGIQLFGG